MAVSGLPRRTRLALLSGLGIVLAIQLAQTLRDRSPWPLCAYNMFNRTLPLRFATMRVRLHDGSGAAFIVDPGEMLPLEFFRARSIMQDVFYAGNDERQKALLAAWMLRNLNERPWRAFDETFAAARPSEGARFVKLDVLVWGLDVSRMTAGAPLTPFEESSLFTYREPEQ